MTMQFAGKLRATVEGEITAYIEDVGDALNLRLPGDFVQNKTFRRNIAGLDAAFAAAHALGFTEYGLHGIPPSAWNACREWGLE